MYSLYDIHICILMKCYVQTKDQEKMENLDSQIRTAFRSVLGYITIPLTLYSCD